MRVPRFTLLLVTFGLLLAGCGDSPPPAPVGGNGSGTPGVEEPPLPVAPADTAEGMLDRAAEKWGGRRAMLQEEGFHIRGKSITYVSGTSIESEVEVWTRYEPYGTRLRDYVSKTGADGQPQILNETLRIVNSETAWVRTPGQTEPRETPQLARAAQSQPTPRKALLHREHNLTLALRGQEAIQELGGVMANRIVALDPSGNSFWIYVDEDFNLRKISYQFETQPWISAVFEEFRDPPQPGMSNLLRVSHYQGGEKRGTYIWGQREVVNDLPSDLFQPR